MNIPDEIQYVFDNYEAEDINISIVKADFSKDISTLEFAISGPDINQQTWSLEILGHRASQINFNLIKRYSSIVLAEHHPLLWQFSDIQCELYFNGKAQDINKLIIDLNRIDLELFDQVQTFALYLDNLYRTSNGLLAKGAKNLLIRYAECLNKHNVESNIIGTRIPTYWDGKAHVDATGLKIFIVEDSYIVGKEFNFEKVG